MDKEERKKEIQEKVKNEKRFLKKTTDNMPLGEFILHIEDADGNDAEIGKLFTACGTHKTTVDGVETLTQVLNYIVRVDEVKLGQEFSIKTENVSGNIAEECGTTWINLDWIKKNANVDESLEYERIAFGDNVSAPAL